MSPSSSLPAQGSHAAGAGESVGTARAWVIHTARCVEVTLSELRAADGAALLRLIHTAHAGFNHLAVGTAFTALHRAQTAAPTSLPPAELRSAVELLEAHFLEHCASKYSVRSLAAVLHAVAQLDVGSDRAFLEGEACALSMMLHHTMTPRALSMLVAAFAKAGRPSPAFFKAAAQSVSAQSEACTPRDISTLVWGYATAGHDAPALFAAMQRSASPRLASFTNQDLSLMLWAYARSDSQHGGQLLLDAEPHVADRIFKLSTQHLSNIAWAYGKLGEAGDRGALFAAIRQAAMLRMPRFRPQELVMMSWAFARGGQHAPELFSALSQQLLPRVGEVGVHGLAMAVWAFASAGVAAPALFTAVSETATPQVPRLSIQSKLMLAWAFAKADHPAEELFDAITESTSPEEVAHLNQQGLANLAWAYGKMGERSPAIFSAIQAAALASSETLQGFSAHGLAALAWAFARGGQPSDELMAAILPVAQNRLTDFSAKGLSMLSWAYAKSGVRISESLLDAMRVEVARRTAAGIVEDGASLINVEELAQLAWAHAIASQPGSHAVLAALREEVQGRDAADFSPYYLATLASAYAHVEARSGEYQDHAELFDALYDDAARRLDEFTPSDLANTVWAHARSKSRRMRELLLSAEPIIAAKMSAFDAPELGLVVWSYAKAGQLGTDRLFALVGDRLLLPDAGLNRLSPAGLATICWAFSKAEQHAEELFNAIARLTERRAHQFDAQSLATIALAFARAGYADDGLFQALASAAALRVEEFTPHGLAVADRAFKLVGQSGGLHEAIRQAAVRRTFRR